MVYDHFQATGDIAQGLSDLNKICLHDDDVQDFRCKMGFKFCWRKVRYLTKMSLKALYQMKSQGSENLQTVLALHNKELSRNGVPPSYQRLRTMVRQHIDQE